MSSTHNQTWKRQHNTMHWMFPIAKPLKQELAPKDRSCTVLRPLNTAVQPILDQGLERVAGSASSACTKQEELILYNLQLSCRLPVQVCLCGTQKDGVWQTHPGGQDPCGNSWCDTSFLFPQQWMSLYWSDTEKGCCAYRVYVTYIMFPKVFT